MTLALLALGLFAGGVGALVGVGGGIIITPVLALYFGVPMHQAIGASLLAVIATSTATSSVYLERHVTNVRLGMTLELATTVGAAAAAVIAGYVDRQTLALLFAAFLFYSALSMAQKAWQTRAQQHDSTVPQYSVRRYGLGMGASLVAGAFSGLLGIGGGPIKVPVMYLFMGVPLRAATATSNFMIGVTAATSAYIYYGRGDVLLALAGPVVAGAFVGSLLGARLAPRVHASRILFLLMAVALYLAVQLLYKALAGAFA